MSDDRKPTPNLLDVVIQVSAGSLDFLAKWRTVLQPYHIIIVQTSAGAKLVAPAGFDVEVHTLADAQKLLGDKLWCLTSGDSLSRSYGYMMSKKRYVYTLGATKKLERSPGEILAEESTAHCFRWPFILMCR